MAINIFNLQLEYSVEGKYSTCISKNEKAHFFDFPILQEKMLIFVYVFFYFCSFDKYGHPLHLLYKNAVYSLKHLLL
jgi:hypothetical protein